MLFLGRSQAILRIQELIDKAARSSSTVLIIGESGVGKDVAAYEIHRLSGRTGRYLPKNCAAFGEGLIESELFGHERGAFTSAVDRRPGIFEQANGGTVFLDEITEMKLELQAKLLRVLEERQVTRLGDHTPIPVDVRVIAASNRPMQEALAVGKLRPDLYYRLKVFQIPIPPLRERLEDLELLVVHFIEEINREQSKDVEGLDNEALALLKAHTWPGNVRELRNVIEQAVVMREHGRLTPRDLPDELCNGRHKEDFFVVRVGTTIDAVKRELAAKTLDASDGNHVRTARILGISTHTLYDLLRKNGLPPRGNRHGPSNGSSLA